MFSWLLEVANDTKEHWDGGRIVWSVSYVNDGPKLAMKDDGTVMETRGGHHQEEIMRKKLIAKLDIQKDDIQAVLPISKVRKWFKRVARGFKCKKGKSSGRSVKNVSGICPLNEEGPSMRNPFISVSPCRIGR